jgi:predicted aspartyl protease
MAQRMLLAAGIRLLLAAALISPLNAQAPQRSHPDLDMPFDLVSNFEVVVNGQVGGEVGELAGLRFIVDTGSSHSVIDARVADRLGLERRPGKVFNFDRNLAVDWANVPELRIGPIRAAGITLMVTRLADISKFAENADGIIGMDVLSRARRMSIDYVRRKVSFELDAEGGSEPSVMRPFVVPVVIQGISMRLLVDTGLEYVVLYEDRLRRALPHLRVDGQPRNAAIGHLRVIQVDLPGIRIFGREAVTSVLLVEQSGNAGVDELDGYLGPASLHANRLELDFATRTLRWQ